MAYTESPAHTESIDRHCRQYQQWGVAVETSSISAVHLANGIVQLLRLVPDPPRYEPGSLIPRSYITAVKGALRQRLGSERLPDEARAFCVTKSKRGPLLLDSEPAPWHPPFVEAGRRHVKARLRLQQGELLPRDMHQLIAGVLNADGRVMESQGEDPTTPGLLLAGLTDPQTLGGMHAATFLGLLSYSQVGCQALLRLYEHLRSTEDPHSRLIMSLYLGQEHTGAEGASAPSLERAFPLPLGPAWEELADTTAKLVTNLLEWSKRGMSKADTLMAVVDLALLVLTLRLLRWAPPASGQDSRLIFAVSPVAGRGALHQVISRAQDSLQAALAALDSEAEHQGLVHDTTRKRLKGGARYLPSLHAANLGAAGGWLFPPNAQGGAKRYFRPGSRQLATLVYSIVPPGQELSWPSFAQQVQDWLGLALGGPNEHHAERRLYMPGGAAASLREAGKITREHLVALGLARQESDNVIHIDGGVQ